MLDKHKKISFSFSRALACLASSWLIASTCMLAFFEDSGASVSFSGGVGIVKYILFVLAVCVPITIIDIYLSESNAASYCFIGSLIAFSFTLAGKLGKTEIYAVLFIVLMISLYCFDKKYKCALPHFKLKNKRTVIITVTAVTVAAISAVCTISVLRYYTYSSPNYDFGIFCNMFYNMKKTGLPVTSCERDKILSHFAVHISPVFYLLLPFYLIFPSPITLAAAQPLIVFSAIIPFYLLAKHLKISENTVMFISIVFALFPALSAGCFYDLHENCFLVPMLMWLFYFFEKDKKIPMFVFVLLVLLVKEDAFIYMAFFAAYIIVSRKKYLSGACIICISGAYFLLAYYLLSKYGLGIMSSRYDNLSDGSGLTGAAKTILIDPGFALSQLLVSKEGGMEKLFYIVKLFCPLVFLPFMNRDFTRFILIIPVFINLLTKYSYQYDISFQYTFGICAFLLYITLLNLSDMKEEKQNRISFAAVIAAAMLFVMIVIPKCDSYIVKYSQNKETYQKITQALSVIEEDADVTSSTYFLPHLTARDIIYEDEYHDEPSTTYYVLDLQQKNARGREKKYIEAGYKLIAEEKDTIEIYRKK